jgi:Cu-processing system permease protein
MNKIIKYVVLDILRNRIVIAYMILLGLLGFSLFNMNDTASKGMLSLMNVVLIIVPLVSIIFSSIYLYNAAEFIELLVSQPLKRTSLWLSLFLGLSLSLGLAFLVGCGLPVIIFHADATGYMLLLIGFLLTVIFVSIALLAGVSIRDKAKGTGLSILLWLYFTLLFDGLVLFLLFQFMDYPLEKAMIGFSALNPVDLSRVLMLLKMDVSAMMGVTSAVFKNVFGSGIGQAFALLIMLLWILFPLWLSVRKFNHKDL